MSTACEGALRDNISTDGVVVFDAGHDRLLKLNAVAAEMVDLLRTGTIRKEVIERIAQRYQVDKMRVAGDLEVMLGRIHDLGLWAVPVPRADAEPQSGISANSQRSFPWYGQYMRSSPPKAGHMTVLCAVLGLAVFDAVLHTLSIKTFCTFVKRWPLRRRTVVDNATTIGRTCDAVERSCMSEHVAAHC